MIDADLYTSVQYQHFRYNFSKKNVDYSYNLGIICAQTSTICPYRTTQYVEIFCTALFHYFSEIKLIIYYSLNNNMIWP